MNQELLHKIIPIVNSIKEHGGYAYIVGGSCRDWILGIPNDDIDIEVFGMSKDTLVKVLSNFGKVKEVGKDFGVFKIAGYSFLDIAIARIERKTGHKHTDFEIRFSPSISLQEASLRRDVTINSIYYDPYQQRYIDPNQGINDLKNKQLRMVNEVTFKEDPLRVFRVAQFASRFNFSVEKATKKLCKELIDKQETHYISKERIEKEMSKLWNSTYPSIGLEFLYDIGYFNSHSLIFDGIIEDYSWIEKVISFLIINQKEDILPYCMLSKKQNKIIQNYQRLLKKMQTIENKVDYYFLLEEIVSSKIDSTILFRLFFTFYSNKKIEEYKIRYGQVPLQRVITGDDLIALGYTNYLEFKKILDQAYIYVINGMEKEEILAVLGGLCNGTR